MKKDKIMEKILLKYFIKNDDIYKFEYSKIEGNKMILSFVPNNRYFHTINYYPSEKMLNDNSWCQLEQKINKLKHKHNLWLNMSCCIDEKED